MKIRLDFPEFTEDCHCDDCTEGLSSTEFLGFFVEAVSGGPSSLGSAPSMIWSPVTESFGDETRRSAIRAAVAAGFGLAPRNEAADSGLHVRIASAEDH